MSEINTDKALDKSASRKAVWIRRLWGLLPVFILMALILILGGMVGAKKEAIEAARKAEMKRVEEKINVVTLGLKPGTIRDKMNLPGMVKAWADLKVMSEVRGKAISIPVDDGDKVKKGDLLVRIDDRDYQNNLKANQAVADAAEANLIRIKNLYEQELATQSQYDLALAEAQSVRASLDSAHLSVDRCSIRAPFAGMVNRVVIEEGQLVNPSDLVVELVDIDRVKVVVGVPESDIAKVKQIEQFDVRIAAIADVADISNSSNSDEPIRARRLAVSAKASPQAHLYTLELAIDNKDNHILPDMFARVEIVKDAVEDALRIPLYAVISQGDGNHVYIADAENRARKQPITLGIQEGWLVEAKTGLKVDDKLIVVGQRSVSDNQLLSVVRSSDKIEDVVR